jgi:hypothetical protein
MSLTLIGNKPVIGNTDEDLRLDLTYPSIDAKYEYQDTRAVQVKPDEVMRPDLLSINFFSNAYLYDMILKANGIANPFSIDANEIYFAPDLEDLISNNAPSGKQSLSSQSIINQYINPKKASLSDNRLSVIEAQRLQAMKNMATNAAIQGSLLPPNVANVGDKEIAIKGGKIYFGPDVVSGTASCSEPLSKSEFLARLIKNSIQ